MMFYISILNTFMRISIKNLYLPRHRDKKIMRMTGIEPARSPTRS